jgi:hypothetical protein
MSTPITDEEREELIARIELDLDSLDEQLAELLAFESRVRLAERERICAMLEEEADVRTCSGHHGTCQCSACWYDVRRSGALRAFAAKLRSEG